MGADVSEFFPAPFRRDLCSPRHRCAHLQWLQPLCTPHSSVSHKTKLAKFVQNRTTEQKTSLLGVSKCFMRLFSCVVNTRLHLGRLGHSRGTFLKIRRSTVTTAGNSPTSTDRIQCHPHPCWGAEWRQFSNLSWTVLAASLTLHGTRVTRRVLGT
jgi:hypothetical protein